MKIDGDYVIRIRRAPEMGKADLKQHIHEDETEIELTQLLGLF